MTLSCAIVPQRALVARIGGPSVLAPSVVARRYQATGLTLSTTGTKASWTIRTPFRFFATQAVISFDSRTGSPSGNFVASLLHGSDVVATYSVSPAVNFTAAGKFGILRGTDGPTTDTRFSLADGDTLSFAVTTAPTSTTMVGSIFVVGFHGSIE